MAGSPLLIGLQAVFVFCVCYAIVSDFSSLRIPNWVPAALAAGFVLLALATLNQTEVLSRLLLAGVVFVVAFVLFAASWLGGGDVKFLTAVVLWIGLESAPDFLMLMSLLGAALALVLIFVRKYSFLLLDWSRHSRFLERLVVLGESGQCPYGVAIGAAALIVGHRLILGS